MIGSLPKSIEIDGNYFDVRSDYRIILHIFTVFNDVDFPNYAKAETALKCFYVDDIPPEHSKEAYEKMSWFMDGGEETKDPKSNVKIMDWEQDEKILFSAINKSVHREVREVEYMHWWTFLGYMREIEESTFTTVVSIRTKRSKGKKLDKVEQEYYNQNKEVINIRRKKTASDLELERDIYQKFGYERR